MELPICNEAPVDLIVNDNKIVTFMCTPQNLKELTVGYLYSRGIIKSIADILVLGACDDMREVHVKISGQLKKEQIGLGVVLSGCGSGGGNFFDKEKLQSWTVDSNFSISTVNLREFFKEMNDRAELYNQTGGMHSAGVISENELVLVQEDVGRHNSVDKAIGKGLFLGLDPSKHGIITTGRLSSDLVLKSIGAGYSLVATRSIPTTMAYDMAKETGIILIGRGARKSPYVYTQSQKISLDDENIEKGEAK
ncbi:formate dehydrogenase accessory sulfurtransferase FdhD [Natranaerofaba carboxydovora]|uniref:formate dehydrogenase accessory sulfurtransferase FdhD n=1 Tax=Natranaerofaba carboxydovora TaxID=2742683 RepID=UPI001F14162A|nr:formate dehydrogenase accessory sulfurtransferase FdhD [Natranaerofaba carboxydovora]UMZ72909.1 Sulfurtransferase FdhD [Natranaerofaba carboxydovora]